MNVPKLYTGWFFKKIIKIKKDNMGSQFFGNKHDNKTSNKNTKTGKNANSKSKGSNKGIRKVGRGK